MYQSRYDLTVKVVIDKIILKSHPFSIWTYGISNENKNTVPVADVKVHGEIKHFFLTD
jgi:hypothetical protein